MNMTVRNLGLAAATAALLAAAPRAQAPELRVEAVLAPDAARSGPPAWTFVREDVLPQVVRDENGVPPLSAATRIRLDAEGKLDVQPDRLEEDLGDAYARFRLFVGGQAVAEGRCAFDGTERWEVDTRLTDAGTLPPILDRLRAMVGPSADRGWIQVDVSTAIGNLMAASAAADVLSDAMTLGAFECETLMVFARPTSRSTLRVVGKSGGGLTLPAVFAALAMGQGGPGPGGPGRGDRDELERHLLLAASAQAAEREEALRQLARFDDAQARDALTRNLFDDGPARTIAVHGLARDRSALDPLLRAAEKGDPLAADVAAGLLPEAVRGTIPAQPAPLGETTGLPTKPPAAPIGLTAALLVGILVGACLGLLMRPRVG